jgi:hypothetical protein
VQKNKTVRCILGDCKFPQTCQWNKACMEVGLKKSLEAKEKKYTSKVEDCSCKNQKRDLFNPGGLSSSTFTKKDRRND